MTEFLFGQKEICNYIEDISCARFSHRSFYFLIKKHPLPYVKTNIGGNVFLGIITSKKIIKVWLSMLFIKSFFKNDSRLSGYKFLFGDKFQDRCPHILMNMLQTIWLDD